MPLLNHLYGVEIYQNAFGRIFEFTLGMLLCRLAEININRASHPGKASVMPWGMFFSVGALIVIYILRTRVGLVMNNQEFLKPVGAILGGGIIYFYYIEETGRGKKVIAESRVIRFFSDYSLEFWIATFFTVELYNHFLKALVSAWDNYVGLEIVVTFVVNLFFARLLKCYSRAVKKIADKIGFKRFCVSILGIFLVLILIKAVALIPDIVKNHNHIYGMGEEVIFGREGCNSDPYIIKGISQPEEGFAWTDGNEVELIFNGLKSGKYDVQIALDGIYNKRQTVQIEINGDMVYSSVIDLENAASGIEFEVDTEETIDMVILLPDAISPQQTGESTDERLLALRLKSIIIQQIQ